MESTKGFKFVMVLDLVLLIAAFAGNLIQLFMLKELTFFFFLIYFLRLAAIICALLYAFLGYKKNAAKFFSWFIITFTLSLFIFTVRQIPNVTQSSNFVVVNMIRKIAVEISYGCLCILCVAKDLGKTKSYILTALTIVCFIVIFILIPKVWGLVVPVATDLILSLVTGLMIYAKYQDKAARGTK